MPSSVAVDQVTMRQFMVGMFRIFQLNRDRLLPQFFHFGVSTLMRLTCGGEGSERSPDLFGPSWAIVKWRAEGIAMPQHDWFHQDREKELEACGLPQSIIIPLHSLPKHMPCILSRMAS